MFGTFGNKVKIIRSPETEEKGLAGKTGEIYGETTPSMMDLEIIGSPKEDYAVNVYFNDLKESYWFDVDLIEYLDNGQGTEIALDGIDKKWIKGNNGEWIEEDTSTSNSQTATKSEFNNSEPDLQRKWWGFWKK